MISPDDVYVILLKKGKDNSLQTFFVGWNSSITYLSALQRALAEWFAPRNAVLQQEPSFLPPSFESMTYLTKFLNK